MNVLFIKSSPNPASNSAKAATEGARLAGIEITEILDTIESRPPAYGSDLMAAVFAGAKYPAAIEAREKSDAYVAQLKKADVVLVAVAMHNFGIPSGLKAWMDQVARPGETFEYSANGPRGLLNGKKVIVVSASGGDYHGESAAMDHALPHVKSFFEFLGATVDAVPLGGMALPNAAESRQAAAERVAISLALASHEKSASAVE